MRRATFLAGCTLGALLFALAACGQVQQQTCAVTEDGGMACSDDQGSVATEAPSATESPVAETPAAEDTSNYPFCEEIGRRVPQQQCEDFTLLASRAEAGAAAFNTPNPMQRGDAHMLQLAIGFAPTPEELAERERLERAEAERAAQDQAAFETARQANTAAAYEAYLAAHPDGDYVEQANAALSQMGGRSEPPSLETPAPGAPSDPAPQPPSSPPPPPTPAETVDPLPGETVEFTPLVGRFMRAELSGAGFEITPLSPASQEVLPDSTTTWNWNVVARDAGQRSLTLRTTVEGCDENGRCYPLRSTSQNYEVEVTVGWLGRIQDLLTAAPLWLQLIAGVLGGLAVLVGAWFGLRNAFRRGRSET